MKVYEVVIGETASLAKDHLLIQAGSLPSAVEKAERKRKRSTYYEGWVITSVKEVGKLES